jgi:hypothetical protein
MGERLEEAIARHLTGLLDFPNVVGVAPGRKRQGGVITEIPAMVVLVTRKVPRRELAPEELIPSHLSGFDTDVLEIGDLRAVTECAGQSPDQGEPKI